MKVYTRTGDQGTGQLPTGLRLSKGDMRFEALGALDELNCLVGWSRSVPECPEALAKPLVWVQERVMTACSQLAALGGGQTEPVGQPAAIEIGPDDTTQLEAAIDAVARQVPMPASFVVPGGSELSCRLHLARVCCRRAERLAVGWLDEIGQPAPALRAFLNRLSDALFVWALQANHLASVANTPWLPRQ